MNGRKSKMLRALAGVNKQNRDSRSYHGVEHTTREKEVTHPTALNEAGMPLVIARHRTATYALNQGARLLNKMLKKQYKSGAMRPALG